MNYHIIGSSGYVGTKLLKKLGNVTNIYKYYPSEERTDIYLDLMQRDESVFSNIKPGDFVVFLAAISSPDECDKNYETAYAINVDGTKWFIENCIKRNANVLFFSSDVVNGACESPVYEDYELNPFGKYGKMKYEVEKAFSNEKNVKIFRLSYVFSAEDKFMKYLESCVKKHEKAEVFNALYRSVVYLEDILEGIVALFNNFIGHSCKIYNFSGPQLLSRADLASMYKENINDNLSYDLVMPDKKFFEARPNIIYTKSNNTELLLGRPLTKISDAMKKEFLI